MNVKETLLELGVTPSKRRGQNFLIDGGAAARLAEFSEVQPSETVLEIGPGLGVLTERLIAKKANLHAVEIEEKFCGYLSKRFPELNGGKLYCQDARRLDLAKLCADTGAERIAVVSNLPYSISTDIVLWLLEQAPYVERATLLLQDEFAERIAANPGTKSYGAITVARALLADAALGPKVGGGAFHPRANVDSRALRLTFLKEPRFAVVRTTFRAVVRAAFSQRRKTLLNSLSSGLKQLSKSEWQELLHELNVDPGCRPETLGVETFAAISNALPKGTDEPATEPVEL